MHANVETTKVKRRTVKAFSKPKSKGKAQVKLRPDGLRVGSAGGLLVDTVCRKAGATHAELCEIVGWKSCMPFLLKSCQQTGVKLRKQKEEDGISVRYFGIRKK